MFPRQSEVELPLLKCLSELGGAGKPEKIYSLLIKSFPGLTDLDLEKKVASGANKWKNCITWVRQRLISIGEMDSRGRGVWAITDKGRKRLESPTVASPGRRTIRSVPSQISEVIPNLVSVASSRAKGEVRARSKPAEKEEVDFENSVWLLVHSPSPDYITVGRDPEFRLTNQTFRPDLMAFFRDSTALIVECKYTRGDAYVSPWISQFRNLKRELEDSLRAVGYRKFVYVLAVQEKGAFRDHTRSDAEQLRIKLVDQRVIEYFRTLQKASGIGIAHLFWAAVAPWMIRHAEKKLPALRIKIGNGREAYIFSANAHDLLSRAFVSHRELHTPEEGQIGYQRMLQKKKINETSKYIKRFSVFPTPLVVTFQKRGAPNFEPLSKALRSTESLQESVEFGFVKLPKEANSIQIIDGQHRLYGYSRLPNSDEHIVHVIAYKKAKDPSPATMFVDINSKQTRVQSSLLWELYPDIYGEDEPDHYKAIISSLVESVARKRLEGFVHHISSGMRGEMSFHTLCQEVNRARLFHKDGGLLKDEKQLQLVLEAFFEALNQLDSQYAGVNRSFVYSNNGIAPMIRTMARVVKYESNHNREANLRKRDLLIETFSNFFRSSYTYYHGLGETQLRQLRKQRVGNAGSNTEEDLITGRIRDSYKNDFPYRRGKAPPAWEDSVSTFISKMDAINRKVTDRAGSWVFREFHAEDTKKKLLKPIDTNENLGTVLKVLYQDLIEGSGKDKTENRLAKLLGLQQIYDLDPIRKLNTLRTCWEHKPGQVDPAKRQSGLLAIIELSGSQGVTGFHDMTPEQYQKTAIALLRKISDEVLTPALEMSSTP